MARTKIQWVTYTFNPWWGCVQVSPACDGGLRDDLEQPIEVRPLLAQPFEHVHHAAAEDPLTPPLLGSEPNPAQWLAPFLARDVASLASGPHSTGCPNCRCPSRRARTIA